MVGLGAMVFFNPSLEAMNKEVLAWDLYDMISGHSMYSLQEIPIRFSSVDQYLDILEPLLLEECRAQTLRSIQGSLGNNQTSADPVTIDHRLKLLSVDDAPPFRLLTFEAPPEQTKPAFYDTDLVFVSYEPLDTTAIISGEHQIDTPEFHALALVQSSMGESLILKLYLPEDPTARLPQAQHRRLSMLRSVMVPSSGSGLWHVRKLGNMVTINREFQALYSIREILLHPILLTPSVGSALRLPPPSLKPSRSLLSTIEHTFNPSQLRAIHMSLCGRGVTLIQGPPGTGKTKTILGILSVLLAAKPEGPAEGEGAIEQAFARGGPLAADDATRTTKALSAAAPWLSATPAALAEAERLRMEELNVDPVGGGARVPFPTAISTDKWLQLGHSAAEEPPRHVLVCAPSNAAIDEIVSRILSQESGEGGLLDAEGRGYRPNVVRVGPNIKESLLDVSIDTLAKERQAAHAKRHTDPMSYDAARMAVLNEAQIVCTTLSCAGYSMFSQCKQGFDTVLIDEASQAVEVSTLIPLKYGCRRLILVGDPKQLPATVFSEPATQHNYEQSLFHRLQRGGHQVALLTTQYRMLPQISRFPAARFYKGALDDAPQLKRAPQMPWHELRCLAPYVFYDVADGRAEELNSSWSNALEAQLALHIVRMLLARYSECLAPSAIGVIAPYNGQVRLIRKLLADEFGSAVAAELEVNSVDGFQGREKSVVLVSCVRSDYARQHARGVGFVKDARRINVSMTRAKHSLFILGHARTLEQEEIWAALLDDARERGCVLTASSPLKIWFEAAAKEPCRAEPPTDDISEPQDPEMPAELAPATVAEATKRRRTTRRQQ